MVNFLMKTTGVFSRVHPNLSMMLHCPLYKAENGTIHSAHSLSQNAGKTRWGWAIFFFQPYSPTHLIFGTYKPVLVLQLLSFQSNPSVLPLLSFASFQEVKTELKVCNVLQLNYLPQRADMSFQTQLQTELSPIIQL